jgi:DNA-binding NtrC family response regulator
MKNSPGLRVLVVDDEALIRWSLSEVLTESGHVVSEAADGVGAVQALETQEPFDVIVLDYRLPDSNDLNLLRTIRDRTPQSAVVMMTAYGTPEVASGALALGVYRVLRKPFEVHDLVAIVGKAYEARVTDELP